MSIFKKNEDQSEENLDEGRKITKELKDLKSENKKKRKEPVKPWGKKERLIVLIVLLATTIISAILLLNNTLRLSQKKTKTRLPSINLDSINIFRGETIVIEKKQ